MRCPAPGVNTTLAEGDRMSATIGLRMDGVENLTMLGVGITVYPNPTFSQFTNVRSFSQNDDIFLTIEVRITSVCLLPVCLSVCLSCLPALPSSRALDSSSLQSKLPWISLRATPSLVPVSCRV